MRKKIVLRKNTHFSRFDLWLAEWWFWLLR